VGRCVVVLGCGRGCWMCRGRPRSSPPPSTHTHSPDEVRSRTPQHRPLDCFKKERATVVVQSKGDGSSRLEPLGAAWFLTSACLHAVGVCRLRGVWIWPGEQVGGGEGAAGHGRQLGSGPRLGHGTRAHRTYHLTSPTSKWQTLRCDGVCVGNDRCGSGRRGARRA
jgi:hypothetical protein